MPTAQVPLASRDRMSMAATPDMPPPTHTRSNSFFSFLSSKQHQQHHHQQQQQQQFPQGAQTTTIPPRQRSLSTYGVPTSTPSHVGIADNSGTLGSSTATLTNANSQPTIQQHQQHQQQPSSSSSSMTVNPVSQSPTSPKPPPPSAPLHAEIRSVVSLTVAHAHKIYFSGPLVKRVERQPDGQKPTKDEGWTEVWAQLGGTTLSIWDMKDIQEASRQGKEVPPTYVNVTDAFVQVLGSVTVPATATQPSRRYTNVLTLNTAGSNLLLFSCPSITALVSWASALRLSSWEKSRLEEIYTAHLIRITLNRPNAPTTLIRGKLEGWARVRVAGQTDWKRVWMVVSVGQSDLSTTTTLVDNTTSPNLNKNGSAPAQLQKKKRMSSLFSRDTNPQQQQPSGPIKPTITMYAGQKPKERKKPLLSIGDVTQAFAVYPERPELISKSTLIKLEGLLGDEEMAQSMRSREGWILFMPEIEGASGNQAMEMLKWVIGIHDAFELYGRPTAWTWDPREPISLMFAYPVGPQRDLLFLDREAAESMDPRDDRTSAIRNKLLELLTDRMHQQQPQLVPQQPSASRSSSEQPPMLPPISAVGEGSVQQQNGATSSTGTGPQLPPLSFSGTSTQAQRPERSLTPITEVGSTMTHGRGMSFDATTSTNLGSPMATSSGPPVLPDKAGSPRPVLDRAATSPRPASSSSNPQVASTSAVQFGRSAQSVKSSTSLEGVAGPVPGQTAQHQPSIAASMSQSPSSPQTAKFKSPSVSAVTSGSTSPSVGANTGAKDSNKLPGTPTSAEPLVSPYSPTHKPVAMTFTESGATSSSGGGAMGRGDERPLSMGGASILTSPYSHGGDHYIQGDTMSVLTSPHSIQDGPPSRGSGEFQPLAIFGSDSRSASATGAGVGAPPRGTSQTPISTQSPPQPLRKVSGATTQEPEDNFLNEAGALFFMHQSRLESGSRPDGAMGMGGGSGDNKPRQVPMPTTHDDEDEDEDEDEEKSESSSMEDFPRPPQAGHHGGSMGRGNPTGVPIRHGTPMAFMDRPGSTTSTSTLPVAPGSPASSNILRSPLGTSTVPGGPTSSPSPPPPRMAAAAGGSPKIPTGLASVAPLRLNNNNNSNSNSNNTDRGVGGGGGGISGGGGGSGPNLVSANKNYNVPSATGGVTTSASTSSNRPLGRKPSGARAQGATSRMPAYNNNNGTTPLSASSHSSTFQQQPQLTEEEEEEEEDEEESSAAEPGNKKNSNSNMQRGTMMTTSTSWAGAGSKPPPVFEGGEEAHEDVLAALSYLQVSGEPSENPMPQTRSAGDLGGNHQHLRQQQQSPHSNSSLSDSAQQPQFKSSFAPSTSAAKRKAKAQAQQAAHHAATHKPGRTNGKKKSRGGGDGGWESTDEEDDDDDEEDDEDADSDAERVPGRTPQHPGSMQGHAAGPGPTSRVYGQLSAGDQHQGQQPPPRAPRTLPQPPSSRPGIDDHHNNPNAYGQPGPRRLGSESQFSNSDRRTFYDESGPQIRSQSEFPQPGAARQTVWSQVLDPGKNVNPMDQAHNNANARDTFVQLEPSETMTKAFTPQGLLSAGLQDKQDRSAKRQEELARGTGASLINVPNKPPPPQTGLLGAITAHERERKREGGVGAALTEREREKRMVEERQRRFDEQQRHQFEQMQQGGTGSMYGGYPGFNPMMNPMMMGMPMMMNPMMTGGGLSPMMTGNGMNPMMGYPGMLNPQQMFAAQQAAAAAYQQAMMAYSTAGSQVGGEGGGNNQPMGQNMTGNMQPMGQNMTGGGYDPRMSMMGMPMMGGMGMGMGGPMPMGGMGGGMGMGGNGMTPTMTGNFDSRFPPGAGGSPSGSGAPGADASGALPLPGPPPPLSGHQSFGSRTNSPVGRGSPLARPVDGGPGSVDRPGTPKH